MRTSTIPVTSRAVGLVKMKQGRCADEYDLRSKYANIDEAQPLLPERENLERTCGQECGTDDDGQTKTWKLGPGFHGEHGQTIKKGRRKC